MHAQLKTGTISQVTGFHSLILQGSPYCSFIHKCIGYQATKCNSVTISQYKKVQNSKQNSSEIYKLSLNSKCRFESRPVFRLLLALTVSFSLNRPSTSLIFTCLHASLKDKHLLSDFILPNSHSILRVSFPNIHIPYLCLYFEYIVLEHGCTELSTAL